MRVLSAINGRVLCGSPDLRATTHDDLIIIHADIIRLPLYYVYYSYSIVTAIKIVGYKMHTHVIYRYVYNFRIRKLIRIFNIIQIFDIDCAVKMNSPWHNYILFQLYVYISFVYFEN